MTGDDENPLFKRLIFLTATLAIVSGVIFRLLYLDRKILWWDEIQTYAIIHCGGLDEIRAYLGVPRSAAQIIEYLQQRPPASPLALPHFLAEKNPSQSPLYYILYALWYRVFGGSVLFLRLLPALGGIVSIAAVAWLAYELYGLSLAVFFGTAIFALSPFFVAFSQEARPYSFWGAVIAASCAALLRACSTRSWRWWAVFICLSALGVLLHGLHPLVIAGQLSYLLIYFFPALKRWLNTGSAVRISIIFCICALIFLLGLNAAAYGKIIVRVMRWPDTPMHFWQLRGQLHGASKIVLYPGIPVIGSVALDYVLLVLAWGSFFYAAIADRKRSALIIICTIVFLLGLSGFDYIKGSILSGLFRFEVLEYETICLVIGRALAAVFLRVASPGKIAVIAAWIILLGLEWNASLAFCEADSFWTKYVSDELVATNRALDRVAAHHPLLLASGRMAPDTLLALALKSARRDFAYQVFNEANGLPPHEGYDRIFILKYPPIKTGEFNLVEGTSTLYELR